MRCVCARSIIIASPCGGRACRCGRSPQLPRTLIARLERGAPNPKPLPNRPAEQRNEGRGGRLLAPPRSTTWSRAEMRAGRQRAERAHCLARSAVAAWGSGTRTKPTSERADGHPSIGALLRLVWSVEQGRAGRRGGAGPLFLCCQFVRDYTCAAPVIAHCGPCQRQRVAELVATAP